MGPGTYEHGFRNNHHIDAPQWTMRAKPDGGDSRNPNPGPGTYENKDVTKHSGRNDLKKPLLIR